ncbi:kinase-like domain-containing protein [Syncephalis plumigaleata]|nr:kinase-like domain-containing protein [Syncephalis plumigaleata]
MFSLYKLIIFYGILTVNVALNEAASIRHDVQKVPSRVLRRSPFSNPPALNDGGRLSRIGKWSNKKSGELYTTTAYYDGQPAYIKCIRDLNLYGAEKKAFDVFDKVMADPRNKHISLAKYVVRRYEEITAGDYRCVVMSSFEEVQELNAYLIPLDTRKATQVQQIFTQILAGVTFMHNSGIIHHDLKLESKSIQCPKIMIIDFDRSTYAADTMKRPDTCILGLCPPEYYDSNKEMNMHLLDTWGIGASLYRVFSYGLPPYDYGKNARGFNTRRSAMLNVLQRQQNTCDMSIIDKWPETDIERMAVSKLPGLLQRMLAVPVNDRPTPEALFLYMSSLLSPHHQSPM